jgi:hypothetical protein
VTNDHVRKCRSVDRMRADKQEGFLPKKNLQRGWQAKTDAQHIFP